MNRIFCRTLIPALAGISLTACSDDDTPQPEMKPASVYGTYVGNYNAFLEDGTLSKRGTGQAMRLLEGTESDTLYMDHISFTDKVSYAFDIRFEGLRVAEDGRTLQLVSPMRVPQMVWKGTWAPMERYTISAFTGHLSADSLYLNFKCGDNLLQFAGKYSRK